MTKAEAERECARLAAEHPDRATHRFLPRESAGGEWSVVKVGLAPPGATTPETRVEERPPTADDPRPGSEQNMGPNVGLPI